VYAGAFTRFLVRYWESMHLRADPPNLVAQIKT
jgi:hypothetical protein